ncbi:hypothetical protein CDL15_Pgr001981 [Punica granatum]|uniref:Uncharacterized protein n=1 Tax=Punica granatum TaxID=22663 RepID=A0A218XBT7_PUNGR|nr:hypothetical protein CDL15_Pgr001981 [Punica granatum]
MRGKVPGMVWNYRRFRPQPQSKLGQASFSEGKEEEPQASFEDFVEDVRRSNWKDFSRGEIRVRDRKRGRRAGGRGVSGLGFRVQASARLLGSGLGRIQLERRIAESARFCDSTIQQAIRVRFYNPDSPS